MLCAGRVVPLQKTTPSSLQQTMNKHPLPHRKIKLCLPYNRQPLLLGRLVPTARESRSYRSARRHSSTRALTAALVSLVSFPYLVPPTKNKTTNAKPVLVPASSPRRSATVYSKSRRHSSLMLHLLREEAAKKLVAPPFATAATATKALARPMSNSEAVGTNNLNTYVPH